MGFVIALLSTICVVVYGIVISLRFESQVKKERILRQTAIRKILLKARIAGLTGGIGVSAIILPTPYWRLYFLFLICAVAFHVWLFDRATKSHILQLKRNYELDVTP